MCMNEHAYKGEREKERERERERELAARQTVANYILQYRHAPRFHSPTRNDGRNLHAHPIRGAGCLDQSLGLDLCLGRLGLAGDPVPEVVTVYHRAADQGFLEAGHDDSEY